MIHPSPRWGQRLKQWLSYDRSSPQEEFYIPKLSEEDPHDPQDFGEATTPSPMPVSPSLSNNLEYIRRRFSAHKNPDLIVRPFRAGNFSLAVLYIDGMSSRAEVNDFILRPLMQHDFTPLFAPSQLEQEVFNILQVGNAQKRTTLDEGIRDLLMGDSLLLMDGVTFLIGCETKGFERRSVSPPQTEGAIKGSQEAFTENIKTNTTLIRRLIKNPKLIVEYTQVGDMNQSPCALLYVEGICNPAIVEEVKRRMGAIHGDLILGSGMLEQFIEDNPFSIFPNVLSTERPDRTATALNEGRVAIIVDGTPFAVIVPITFRSMLTTPEDTNLRWQYGTLLRFIRALALLASLLLPSIYIALTTFHQEMIPIDILIAIAQARENVPFPTFVEVLLMEISFELIREAGTRVPGILGSTIGIVGALILGQASVEAGLVSPVLIIIIAFTGIGSFAMPDFSLSFGVRLIRLTLVLCGSVFGFLGIAMGGVVILSHMVAQSSFGVNTMAPYAPPASSTSHNLVWRQPVWKQELRDDELHTTHRRNQPPVSRRWTKEPSPWRRKK